jgi:aminoglycoside 3-N-acetyltransferase
MPRPDTKPQRSLTDDSVSRLIAETDAQRTRESLLQDMRAIGIQTGDRIMAHTSMRSLGWVNGGAVAYIQALQDAVGENGAIVMPTQSGYNSDPGDWRHPPIPPEWVDEVKRTMPAYDQALTPTRRMGAVSELFRTMPGVFRSSHPSGSFAAWGANAEAIAANHGVQRIGEESPAAKLYDLDGKVLLVGVGYDRNTSFHLAEYRADSVGLVPELLPLVSDGVVKWTEVIEIEFMNDETLVNLGIDFEERHDVNHGRVGSAECRLFSVRECVDFGVHWLDRPE